MKRDTRNVYIVLALIGLLIVVTLFTRALPLQVTGGERISLWSAAEIHCDDMVSRPFLWQTPSSAKLVIDADPVTPSWPFYYGGIVAIVVNGETVKTYDPPLVDKDELDISGRLKMGFNEVRAVPKVAALLCNVQTQGMLSGYIDVTYSPPGGGGGGDGGHIGGEGGLTILIVVGLGLMVGAVFFMVRRRG
ncbi:MAG: hypothetical protein QXQ70_03135 [Candidatus Caldarchaeum sp.]